MTLYYETGLFIEIRPQESVDYEGIVKQFEKEKEKGNLKSDNLPKVINFRGVKAFAGEPGYNVWDNYKEPRAGVLMWCEGGVQYSVYGFNMSLDNIKQVANSIE